MDIVFNAKEQKELSHKLTLEVEDTENTGVKQEPKEIELKAEAFFISVKTDLRNEEEDLIDFGNVRVGEPKEKVIALKNEGKYPVQFNFHMRRKFTREIFTIEPIEGQLEPDEEKEIKIRFESKKEIKLKTSKATSDIKLHILEGESKEKSSEQPINVNANAVFSNYTITPLRNINFGPMQYEEQK